MRKANTQIRERADAHGDERAPTAQEREDFTRGLHSMLLFWTVCLDKRCKRARACRGALPACRQRHWPHVPEELKAWLQKAIAARSAGLSPLEAAHTADRAMADYQAAMARIDAREAAMKATPNVNAPAAATPVTQTERVPARVRVV